LGIFAAVTGAVLTIILIVNKILSPDIPMGWSSMMCILMMLFGILLMMMGVFGEYVGKTLLMLNKTPQYIVRDEVGIKTSRTAQKTDFAEMGAHAGHGGDAGIKMRKP
jgi:undecaprenyl-phosphate 4-deoxy-4-formamido-L-arabinose transferase